MPRPDAWIEPTIPCGMKDNIICDKQHRYMREDGLFVMTVHDYKPQRKQTRLVSDYFEIVKDGEVHYFVNDILTARFKNSIMVIGLCSKEYYMKRLKFNLGV